jgi:hypothetical protein
MTTPTTAWIPLPLDGVRLRELVHYACSKDPDAKLLLDDGRAIAVSIGDLELHADGALQISMESHGDSTYIARYSGPDLVIDRIEINSGGPGCDQEFVDDVDAWVAGGYASSCGYVVNARITISRESESEAGPGRTATDGLMHPAQELAV